MANTEVKAAEWVRIIAARKELPFGARLLEHFKRCRITHLCQCGCNSFECETVANDDLRPLFEPDGKPWSLEAVFESETDEPISVRILADEQGMLSGIDVHLGLSNQTPMPERVQLGRLIFTIPEL